MRRYLKLAGMSASLCAISTIDLDAQCRMNRLPISTQTTFSTVQSKTSPAFSDIDNDGDFDLIVGSGFGISTYENKDGFFKLSFGLVNPFHNVVVGFNSAPAFVDIDGDGDSNVFIGESSGTIHFFRNDNSVFSEVVGVGNPFNGLDVGTTM